MRLYTAHEKELKTLEYGNGAKDYSSVISSSKVLSTLLKNA